MLVGIDKIAFYAPHYYLELGDLASHRGIDPDKYRIGLGQYRMAVAAPDEDIVTMAANAADRVLNDDDRDAIRTLLFATESSIDQSKAAGIYVHQLLKLNNQCRIVELKQACYSATHALQMACAWVRQHPQQKVLMVASDVARYGLNTPGEPSQGGGAVALLISAYPHLVAIEPGSGLHSEDVMDFWRPNYRREALVEGKYSAKIYLHALRQAWQDYKHHSGRQLLDHDYFLYHVPVPRLAEKAHKELMRYENKAMTEEAVQRALKPALQYCREIGNTYTAALYISLISLLENQSQDLSNKRIGFYSYGSGCVAEYFSGQVQPGYQQHLNQFYHQQQLGCRQQLTVADYEKFFLSQLPSDGSDIELATYQSGHYRLKGMVGHKRLYQARESNLAQQGFSERDGAQLCPGQQNINHYQATQQRLANRLSRVSQTNKAANSVRAISPGKIILSGEHAVVHGQPAIAMAVNRYAETTVSLGKSDQSVDFNLLDLNYHKSVTRQTLNDLKSSLKRKYHKFLNQQCHIQDVIKQPFQLVQFAASHFLDHVQVSQSQGLKIDSQSNIPVGCGMGSSAAITLTVLKAIDEYYCIDEDDDYFFNKAKEIENLQHGKSSGVDLRISLNGGCIYVDGDQFKQIKITELPMLLVNTGQPSMTTGETVVAVAKKFDKSAIWQQFAKITNQLAQALQTADHQQTQLLIHQNHQLLCQIGVVPNKIKQFIADLANNDIAAKICGAGSASGDYAGIVLVMTDQLDAVNDICRHYHYQAEIIQLETKGLHIA